MAQKKYTLQKLEFDKKFFSTKKSVRNYILSKGYVLNKKLKEDVKRYVGKFEVQQKSKWFFRKDYIERSLGKGVKGVYGVLRKR